MTDLHKAAQQALLHKLRAHIVWLAYGECRSPGFDGPPPTAREAVDSIDTALAAQAPASFDDWLRDHGGYLNDDDDAAKAARIMAQRAYQAALAAQAQPEEPAAVVPAWQPIETAPRGSGEDGPGRVDDPVYVEPPDLLLWTQEGPCVGYYDWYYHPGYGRGARPEESPWRCAEGGQAWGPTHWMPIPTGPDALSTSPASKAEAVVPAGFVVSIVMILQSPGTVNTQNKLYHIDAVSADEAHGKAIPMAQADFPGYTFHTVCHWALSASPAAPAKEQGEPLFLLHIGDPFGGEPGEWETEANGQERVEEFCRQHPGQTVKLYADTQKDHP